MKPKTIHLEIVPVEELIQTVRGHRVILDADLARIYGVPTRQINQAVKRNKDRFPEDFAFQLEPQEVTTSRSQIVILKRGQNLKFRPYAFTEHGAIMAANVLRSPRAIQMSVFVVRAFVKMRETLAQNKELAAKLAELERTLTARIDNHENAIGQILDEIKKLMAPPPEPKRREIGFHVRDEADPKPAGSRTGQVQSNKKVGTSATKPSGDSHVRTTSN
jgi:phage regulator Rha-like protein